MNRLRLGTSRAISGLPFLAVGLSLAAELNPVPQIESSQPVPLVRAAATGPAVLPSETRRLLYEQTFQAPSAIRDFVFTDATAWRVSPEDGGPVLELATQSHYEPPVRSPVNIALIDNLMFADFRLDCEVLQTGREYGHRDFCLFFGFQNPTNFYYAHLAAAADEHAHNLFLVKDAPRTKIANETTQGVVWGTNLWHRIRLERELVNGAIRVFFDDLSKPIMVGEDRTFGSGYVGFGSFDDTGKVRNIRISGVALERKPISFFPQP
jgi:hypothetical protein